MSVSTRFEIRTEPLLCASQRVKVEVVEHNIRTEVVEYNVRTYARK